VDRQRLIDAYWEQYRLSTSGDRGERLRLDEWFWAWEDVERAVHDADGDVVELLVALAEAAPDGARGYVGAGPIENLIDRHGARFVDQIDDAARRSAPFRTALRSVSYGENVDRAVVARLQRFGRSP